MRLHRLALSILLSAALAAGAVTPPKGPRKLDDRRMSNVYVLAHAGAILDICLASPDAGAFPEAKSREIGDLAARLAAVVRSIGTHFRDSTLFSIYEATKANMAADTKLRFHVKSNHQYCGERTLGEMRAYVAENEALIGNYLQARRAAAAPEKK
jgi:hypothetical protein